MASECRPHRWLAVLLPGLALSIGWGIRGNFGHEAGAAIPGALAAIAAVLASGRPDWHRRVAYFGALGGIGWCFGGTISYGHIIGYTQSGDPTSQLYGFACLFLIGFLWAALGAAATALPAVLSRDRLTELFGPILAFLGILVVQEFAYPAVSAYFGNQGVGFGSAHRQEDPLYWFDTDWTAALLALVSTGIYAALRRRWDRGCSLMAFLALGWWAGFLLFPVLLDWRLSPPRGDSWAGCSGMVGGLLLYLRREGLSSVTRATLTAGLIGGVGFATASMLKLVEMLSGMQLNYHSIMEQSYGLINGIGIGVAMWQLRGEPEVSDEGTERRWTDWAAPAAVLLLIPYMNIRQNPEQWIKEGAMEPLLFGMQPLTWMNLVFAGLGLAGIGLMLRHRTHPIAILPPTWLGRGQLLFVTLLATVVVANFERALPNFAEGRIVTEWIITLNAILVVTLALAFSPSAAARPDTASESSTKWSLSVLTAVCLGSVVVNWAVTRAAYGDKQIGGGTLQIRFGPRATAVEKPKAGAPHP